MRAFTAQQRALAASSSIKPILLVVLTTYADRALGTVDTVYYLSDRPVMYDYGNTGTVRQFETLVLSVFDLTQSIPHVPGTTPAGLEAELRVTLSNLPYRGGVPFVRELRAHNLEFATLELATVYGPLDQEAGWYDLRAYTGDEHVVELRGEVEMAEGIDAESFQLRVTTREVPVPWLRADDATITDPKDLGARLPMVYGAAKRVPCVNWQVGWTTTLTAIVPADAGASSVLPVTDATGFPTTTFTVSIDGESIALASRATSGDPLVISARAADGTSEAEHKAGANVIEIVSEAIIVAAGHAASAMPVTYIRNPYSRELFATAIPRKNLNDSALNGWTTLRLSAAEQTAIYVESASAARITVQPEFVSETPTTITKLIAPVGLSYSNNSPADEYLNFAPPVPSLKMTFAAGAWQQSANCIFTGAQGLTSDVVQRYRVKFTAVADLRYGDGDEALFLSLYYRTLPGLPFNGYLTLTFFTNPTQIQTQTAYSSWVTVNQAESAFAGAYCEVVFNTHNLNASPYDSITLSSWGIEVEETSASLDRVTDAAAAGPGLGFGLDFYADVSGPTVPATYVAGYGFEESSGWNTSGCTVAADTTNKTDGAQSIKITVDETEIETLDSGAGSWSATRCTATNDSGEKTRGSASMKLVATTAYQSAFVWRQGLTAADWTGKVIAFDVRLTSLATWAASGSLTNTLGVRFGVSSHAAYADNIKEWTFGLNAGLSESWVTVCFDPATYADIYYETTAALDLANVRGYMFVIQQPTATPALLEMRVDSLRLLPATAIAQRNATTGTVDLTADALAYRLSTYADERAAIASGSKVYVSDTAGSGTTPPAARRELALDASQVGDGAFAAQEIAAADVGSPTVANVETVGVSIALPASPPQALLGPPVLRVDGLERRDDSASLYDAAVGDLIEHPADVTRHLLTARCGLADSYADTATLDAWAANAPDVKLAVDLRALGETLPELLARIGYEGRANVLRAEGAATSAYKALCAEADYTWPASSGRALTQYQALSEVGRDGREIATRFQFLYDRDPSRGTDLAAYDGLLRANPTVSDVSVSAATLATREQKYGRRDADVGVLLAHRNEASAQDVAGYYVAEAGRDAGTFVLRGCAWWEAADVEIGDLLDLAPPWRASAIKVRAVEVTRKFGAGVVDLRAVEVA